MDLLFGFFVWAIVAATLGIVAITEWWMRLSRTTLSPWFWTLFALVVGGFAAYRMWRIQPQLKNYRLGIRGEREVGRMLEDCRRFGYAIFHDIRGNSFNVDHVLIGPGGVFAIETKTRSKPSGRKAIVDFDGQNVLVDGKAPDRDPITQTNANADFVRDLLKRMTARDVKVRPVVLFPGWWVTRRLSDCSTWVLNPRELFGFLENEKERLSPEDIALFQDRLTLHLSSES
jgi:hypothetical protein